MQKKCEAEIFELHQFFVEWMTGAQPRTPRAFERFDKVISDGFVIISPDGVLTKRAPLCDQLEAAHGVHCEAAKNFRIWIEDYQCRRTEGDICLVTYQEWQQLSGATTGRLSTALFRSCPDTPNEVKWLHVHETWLPGQAAPT
ncbi:MAG: hypothetical protein ACE5JS_02005 [Nitrospinota bacterium]